MILSLCSLRRIPYTAAVCGLAAAFPFFEQVLGLIGGMALTPLCFVVPPILKLVAYGRGKLGTAAFIANVVQALVFSVGVPCACVCHPHSMAEALFGVGSPWGLTHSLNRLGPVPSCR